MSPAEAAIREAMSDLTAGTLHADFLAQACNPTAIHSLLSELDALRGLCACAYQLAGVVDAPLPWLDALSCAANGQSFSNEGLLPVGLEHLDAFAELRARCEAAEALLREVCGALQFHQEQTRPIHGTTIALGRIDAHLKGAGRE